MTVNKKLRLVVIPSDPIEAYVANGLTWLEEYYNPTGIFHEVYALSPLETGIRDEFGMTIIGVEKRNFRKKLKEIKPDIVRAYGGFWPAELAIRNRIRGVPIIVSVHDSREELLSRVVCFADIVICTSEIVKQVAISKGVMEERIRVLPNRVDLSTFYPIRDQAEFDKINGYFPEGKSILFVGRKAVEKNLESIIRAMELLDESYYSIFLGPGADTPYMKLAESLSVVDRCTFLGAVKNDSLPVWYSRCDCFCAPSKSEGFGIVFIEAAACGSPIVTSNIPPMNEYFQHNISAYLVDDYSDPKEIARGIRTICEDKTYRDRISGKAISVAMYFRKDRVDQLEAEIYSEPFDNEFDRIEMILDYFSWNVTTKAASLLHNIMDKLMQIIHREE